MQKFGDPVKNSFVCGCKLKIDTPTRYRIQFVGELNESWSERLGGLKITPPDQGEKQTITTLSGLLPDQAALFGVLKALYDMRLPLLSVVCLEDS